MPGNASGGMDGIALKPLTVSFSEPGFVAGLGNENRGGDEKLNTMGPQNPQSLNRYSYVLNNPVRNTDPSGHDTWQINIGGMGFGPGSVGRGGFTLAFDDKGNVALLAGGGGGPASTIGGFSSGPGIGWTNAPTVYDLAGKSVQTGFVGGEGIGISAEDVFFTDSNNIPRSGFNISTGGTIRDMPVSFYGTAEYDTLVVSGNYATGVANWIRDAATAQRVTSSQNGQGCMNSLSCLNSVKDQYLHPLTP